MRRLTILRGLGLWLACACSLQVAAAAENDGELLEGEGWQALGSITGFHSVQHKKSGFEVRLLEADGGASVAWDPVGLYLVVTNNGTSDGIERTWRLRRGVARVKGLVATQCGADVRVEVDRITSEGEVRGTMPRILRVCFLDSKGSLETRLRVSEVSR
ncbi:MAG: hypothetical protein JWM82_2626 [Myxococcales bacterium]|nr:hypothetical protein [Myxococcales bacterium]